MGIGLERKRDKRHKYKRRYYVATLVDQLLMLHLLGEYRSPGIYDVLSYQHHNLTRQPSGQQCNADNDYSVDDLLGHARLSESEPRQDGVDQIQQPLRNLVGRNPRVNHKKNSTIKK